MDWPQKNNEIIFLRVWEDSKQTTSSRKCRTKQWSHNIMFVHSCVLPLLYLLVAELLQSWGSIRHYNIILYRLSIYFLAFVFCWFRCVWSTQNFSSISMYFCALSQSQCVFVFNLQGLHWYFHWRSMGYNGDVVGTITGSWTHLFLRWCTPEQPHWPAAENHTDFACTGNHHGNQHKPNACVLEPLVPCTPRINLLANLRNSAIDLPFINFKDIIPPSPWSICHGHHQHREQHLLGILSHSSSIPSTTRSSTHSPDEWWSNCIYI